MKINMQILKENKKVIVLILFGLAGLIAAYIMDSNAGKKAPTTTTSTYNVNVNQSQNPTSTPNIPPEEIKNQQQAEQDFYQGMRNIQETYPWYSKLPIDTADFMIVYDWDEKKFLISLKNPKAQTKALDALKAIGVDIAKEGYYVVNE